MDVDHPGLSGHVVRGERPNLFRDAEARRPRGVVHGMAVGKGHGDRGAVGEDRAANCDEIGFFAIARRHDHNPVLGGDREAQVDRGRADGCELRAQRGLESCVVDRQIES